MKNQEAIGYFQDEIDFFDLSDLLRIVEASNILDDLTKKDLIERLKKIIEIETAGWGTEDLSQAKIDRLMRIMKKKEIKQDKPSPN